MYVGSLEASIKTLLIFSSFCFEIFDESNFRIGTKIIVKMLIIAKTSKTLDHGMIDNNIAANGGPIT